MKLKRIWLLLLVCLALLFFIGCTQINETINTELNPSTEVFFIFDTIVSIKLYETEDATVHFDKIKNILERIDSQMNRNRENTEIYLVNQNAGITEILVSDETYFVVERALQHARNTNGMFDPTIGPLVDLWNVTYEGTRVPSPIDIEQTLPLVNYENVLLNQENQSIYLTQSGMSLDLGGIAKGYAGDVIKQYLTEEGIHRAILDLGGDVIAHGKRSEDSLWRIGIQSPHNPRGASIGMIGINNQTILASGIYERYFIENEELYHHIIDSTTGYPANNELVSITVIADVSIDADALATGVFAMGLQQGLEYIESLESTDAIFITQENEIYLTTGITEDLVLSDTSYTIIK